MLAARFRDLSLISIACHRLLRPFFDFIVQIFFLMSITQRKSRSLEQFVSGIYKCDLISWLKVVCDVLLDGQ